MIPILLIATAILSVLVATARIQHTAPAFKAPALVKTDFQDVSLEDYKNQWVFLFFYPLDFTFVCPTEIIEMSERIPEFKQRNVAVLGCSIDSKFSHLAWTKQPRSEGGIGALNFPLVSDISKKIASDYGVLIEDGPDAGVALRASFLIDPQQKIRHISMNDLPVGRNVEEILRLVDAFQEHGEVCPMGWKKGDKAMNVLKASEYFAKVFNKP